jgi:hypothetical protein
MTLEIAAAAWLSDEPAERGPTRRAVMTRPYQGLLCSVSVRERNMLPSFLSFTSGFSAQRSVPCERTKPEASIAVGESNFVEVNGIGTCVSDVRIRADHDRGRNQCPASAIGLTLRISPARVVSVWQEECLILCLSPFAHARFRSQSSPSSQILQTFALSRQRVTR